MKKNFSLSFTSLAIKAAFVLCTVSLFVMPYAAGIYRDVSISARDVTVPLLITFYTCAAAGYVILFILDRLVNNIIKGEVFTNDNVKYLRIMSYCCFFISAVALAFAYFRFLSCIVTFSSLFFALILRVLKNCFEEAVRIKEENDWTI